MVTSSKVLVTFGIICYKQESFIKEAILSALSQTYSPLEIVITDDCSPDNTFQIVEDVISNYTGSHKVIINRNEHNLGLAGNINRMWELSSGEFLVIQAGDDISVPYRTSRLVDAWLSTNPPSSIVYSNEMFIDEQGETIAEKKSVRMIDSVSAIKESLTGRKPFVIGGCSAGYARDIHFEVGPLLADVIAEDFVYSFRALLSAGCIGVNEPLIMYRQNSESIMGKLKARKITRERLLRGQMAKLIEYKKAIDLYGNVKPFLRWQLNRQIKLTERNLIARNGGFIRKISFIIWMLYTGRYMFLFDYFKHNEPMRIINHFLPTKRQK